MPIKPHPTDPDKVSYVRYDTACIWLEAGMYSRKDLIFAIRNMDEINERLEAAMKPTKEREA